mgnify:CR=1 FL=1
MSAAARASSPSGSSLRGLTALEQARRIREGTLTSEELVAFYLDRIARLDGRLAAFVSTWPDAALAEARRKDRQRRDGGLPPFHGVPVASCE